MKRGQIIGLVLGLVLFAFLTSGMAQEKYPSRQVEMIVPYSAGGSDTLIARIYCDELGRMFNVPFVVVNRAGGGGLIGTNYVARAKKDGYTLLQAVGDTIVTMPLFEKKEVTYDPVKDLTPLAGFGGLPVVFAVPVTSPFKTFNELLDYARKNPGKLKMGCSDIIGEAHFNLGLIDPKLQIVTVPFEGGAKVTAAILGGHVDFASGMLSAKAQMGPHIKDGKLRALLVTSEKRHPDFPDIPTTTELGYPEATINNWYGIFAPAGVPQSVLDVLVPSLEKVFKNPAVISECQKASLIVDYRNPEQMRKFIDAQHQRLERVGKILGVLK